MDHMIEGMVQDPLCLWPRLLRVFSSGFLHLLTCAGATAALGQTSIDEPWLNSAAGVVLLKPMIDIARFGNC